MILDYTLLSARSQPRYKPSGSPAVHFWVLQAGDCWNSETIFSPFSPLFFCNCVAATCWARLCAAAPGFTCAKFISHATLLRGSVALRLYSSLITVFIARLQGVVIRSRGVSDLQLSTKDACVAALTPVMYTETHERVILSAAA